MYSPKRVCSQLSQPVPSRSYKRYKKSSKPMRSVSMEPRSVPRYNKNEESTQVFFMSKSKPKPWITAATKLSSASYTKFLSSQIFTSGNGYQACENFLVGKTTELTTITNNAQTVSASYRSTNASLLLETMSATLRLTNSSNVPVTVTCYQIIARRQCELGPLALWDKYASAEGSSAYVVDSTPFRAKGFGSFYKILRTTTHTIQGGCTISVLMNFDVNYKLAWNNLIDGDSQFNVPWLTRSVLVRAVGGLVQDSVNRTQVTTGDVSIAYDLKITYKWSLIQGNSTTIFENGQYGLITNLAKFVNEDSDEIVAEETV